jgi:hypothetical protein
MLAKLKSSHLYCVVVQLETHLNQKYISQILQIKHKMTAFKPPSSTRQYLITIFCMIRDRNIVKEVIQ